MTYETWRITYQNSEQAARAAYAEAERLRTELAALTPEDPMDWKLPCDVIVGHGTIGKGCKLRTLVARMKVLYSLAIGEAGLQREQFAVTPGVIAIADERRRQIEAEGWALGHDDQHGDGSLAMAAICYASWAHYEHPNGNGAGFVPINWPWSASWWKPTTHRRNLEKAGALIAAELDRLIRMKESA